MKPLRRGATGARSAGTCSRQPAAVTLLDGLQSLLLPLLTEVPRPWAAWS